MLPIITIANTIGWSHCQGELSEGEMGQFDPAPDSRGPKLNLGGGGGEREKLKYEDITKSGS
jgi:hypothetical protein